MTLANGRRIATHTAATMPAAATKIAHVSPSVLWSPVELGRERLARRLHRYRCLRVVEQEQPRTQINVVLNWSEELKRLSPTK